MSATLTAARPAPAPPPFAQRWRRSLAAGWGQLLGSLACLALLAAIAPGLLRWAVTEAVPSGNSEACRAAAGACWAFLANKADFFLFGFYPAAERWRGWCALAVLGMAVGLTLRPASWRPRFLLAIWVPAIPLFFWLMGGGLGLTPVPTGQWSGLPLSLMLSLTSILVAFPFGVMLALGRRSDLPLLRWFCTALVEIPRGVPFLTILFTASIMLPLFLPPWLTPDKFGRALLAFLLIAACYHAEALRGALQTLPPGQYEAARALGLGFWRATWLVVLPQAFRTALPALTNNALTFLKETSLVSVIGLYDLMGTVQAGSRDPEWLGYAIEGFVFAAAFYLTACAALAAYSAWLETRLARA